MIRHFKSILIFSFFSILISNIILVPEDYSDIQGAINNSMENDTIMVSPGTYIENININNHSIFLISAEGPINTIINGSSNGSVINIDAPGNHVEITQSANTAKLIYFQENYFFNNLSSKLGW